MLDQVEQIWLLGAREGVDSAFTGLRQSLSSVADQVLLAVNRRDLWHDGRRVGLATEITSYRQSVLEKVKRRGLGVGVQTLSVKHAPGADAVHVQALDGSVDYFIPTDGLNPRQAMVHAVRQLQASFPALYGEQPVAAASVIAQAAWQGVEAVHALLPTLDWTPLHVEQWWASLQDWLHMRPCLADEQGNALCGLAWTRSEREDRLFALTQGLPGMERAHDAMAAYCLQQVDNEVTEQGKQREMELRQATFGQWVGREELWARTNMAISLDKPNTPWTMNVFQELPAHLQHAALARSWDRWTSTMSNFSSTLTLSPQLPQLWEATQDWPEWPAVLGQWHSVVDEMSPASRAALDAIDAQRQQQRLDEDTPSTPSARRGARL